MRQRRHCTNDTCNSHTTVTFMSWVLLPFKNNFIHAAQMSIMADLKLNKLKGKHLSKAFQSFRRSFLLKKIISKWRHWKTKLMTTESFRLYMTTYRNALMLLSYFVNFTVTIPSYFFYIPHKRTIIIVSAALAHLLSYISC